MKRRVLSLGACLVLSLTLFPATGASAHKSIRLGKYTCYEWTIDGPMPTGFHLKIKSSSKYVLIKNETETFGGGRYVHDGKKLRFKSGHLHNKNWKGEHSVDGSGNHAIELVRTAKNGIISSYDCSNPK